jgi:hypothetical protein
MAKIIKRTSNGVRRTCEESDPIYSKGWTIGSAIRSSAFTSNTKPQATETSPETGGVPPREETPSEIEERELWDEVDDVDAIEKWETALSAYTNPTKNEWNAIFKEAAPKQWKSDPPVSSRIPDPLELLLEDYEVGYVNKDFPHSVHGDSCNTSVHLLPGGTTIMTRQDSDCMDGPDFAIYHGKNCNEMVSQAWDLIETYFENINVIDEDEDEDDSEPSSDENMIMVISGEKSLRANWKAAMKKVR